MMALSFMTRRHGTFQRIALLAALAAAAMLCASAATAGARGLQIGITDPAEPGFGEVDVEGAYTVARQNGLTIARVPVFWGDVVGPEAPRQPRNPDAGAYNFKPIDERVRGLVAHGIEPLLSVTSAPLWARTHRPDGRRRETPNPSDFAAFMEAIARRYDGTVRERVRLFQLWNEPNLKTYLDQEGAPDDYRAMLAAAYPVVKAVHPDNLVVAGGTAPFAGPEGRYGVGPLKFTRELLAQGPVEFDVWAHHPYTSGPPARHATERDDASIGDVPKIRALLRKAKREGRVRSTRMWATELSWDSAPPDPFAVPLAEHARWVAEGLYRMWKHGVEVVVWFQLRDNPKGTFTWGQTWQSGLFFKTTDSYAQERAKPALTAMRFPFVALPAGRRVTIWGRTPEAKGGRVAVEVRRRGRWRRVASVRPDGDGIFRRTLRGLRGARLRARLGGDKSLPFVARKTRDRFVNPFGGEELPPQPGQGR
jgi:hypothetical protein